MKRPFLFAEKTFLKLEFPNLLIFWSKRSDCHSGVHKENSTDSVDSSSLQIIKL